jgi:hypothetical protein
MKYMLLMQGPKSGWSAFNKLSAEDIQAHVQFMKDLNEELKASGEFVDGQGLAFPDEGKIVQADDQGRPVITDGPFPEAKEFLAGYWIVDCESLSRVLELAGRISAAPLAGKPAKVPVHVRQVMSAPGKEM